MAAADDHFPPALLVADLENRGLRASLRAFGTGGDADLRLHIRVPGGEACVELLGPLDERASLPSWHAVRAAHADRAVWVGPPVDGPIGLVTRFVSDLLTLEGHYLLRRWRRLS